MRSASGWTQLKRNTRDRVQQRSTICVTVEEDYKHDSWCVEEDHEINRQKKALANGNT